jgi:hypothetical protein
MQFFTALIVVFWWISIWGIFEIYTEDKTKEEKMKIYLIILGLIIIFTCFFPKIIHQL